MSDTVYLPGGRDARGTLDSVENDADRVVVACPPHPQRGGGPTDERLRAVSDVVGTRGADCLRIAYGPWAEGRGERRDVEAAVEWTRERYGSVGLFGYSFGATLALVVGCGGAADAVAALAPAATLGEGLDAVDAVSAATVPTQVCVGERDTTVDWERVADAARERGLRVETLPADHFFVGQAGKAAEVLGEFLLAEL